MDGEKANPEVLLTLNSENIIDAIRDWLRKTNKTQVMHGRIYFHIQPDGDVIAVVEEGLAR